MIIDLGDKKEIAPETDTGSCEDVRSPPRPRSMEELYCKLVKRDPVSFRLLETLLRSASYMTMSRLSTELSEFLFMGSNLLQYAHDMILQPRERTSIPEDHDSLESDREKLEQMLNVINITQVFIEMSARRLGGVRIKWIIIIGLTVTKVAIRLCLLFHHKRILVSDSSTYVAFSDRPKAWIGKRSGIRINQTHPSTYIPYHVPNNENIMAELCYILKPIAHLILHAGFSSKSWIPYLSSFSLDMYSLRYLNEATDLTERQNIELQRRKWSLLLYLLRSPFYSQISQRHIESLLEFCGNLPVLNFLTYGLSDYLSQWRQIYGYMWGS